MNDLEAYESPRGINYFRGDMVNIGYEEDYINAGLGYMLIENSKVFNNPYSYRIIVGYDSQHHPFATNIYCLLREIVALNYWGIETSRIMKRKIVFLERGFSPLERLNLINRR
jgi:hypothetical protein